MKPDPVGAPDASAETRRLRRVFAAWRDHGYSGLGRTAGALLGLILALPIGRALTFRAAADQLPGFAKSTGVDPRQDVVRWALYLTLPILFAWIGQRVGRRFRPGAAATAVRSLRVPTPVFGILIALPVVLTRHPARAIAVAVVGTAFCWVAMNRRVGLPRPGSIALPVSAAYAVVLWTLLAPLGLAGGIDAWSLALGLVAIAVALAWLLGGRDLERGAPFLGAAALLLPLASWGGRPVQTSAAAAGAGLLLPFVAALAGRGRPGVVRWCRRLALFLLLPGCFTALAAAYSFKGPATLAVFEHGHSLLPASEYLRGEVPYRDFVPGHGFLHDGGLQTIGLSLFEDSYRGAILPERILGAFYWPVLFLLGFAATGSVSVAFAGAALSFLAFPEYGWLRGLPSIAATALGVYASRTRSVRAWFFSAFAAVLGLAWAVEFFLYTLPVLAVALFVSRGDRARGVRFALGGLVAGLLAVGLYFLVLGVLREFLETTFLFVPSLFPVYATGPSRLGGLAPLAFLHERDGFFLAFCAVAAVTLGAGIVRAPAVGGRARGLLPILAWVLIACLSIVERNHVEYAAALVPLGLVLLARWLKGHRPWNAPRSLLAAVLMVCGLLVWRPRAFVPFIAIALTIPAGTESLASFPEIPRARGAAFSADDARIVRSTKAFLEAGVLARSETWFDFSNMPGLYFLFDRDCPVPYYETGFYESAENQRRVIEALDRDRRVQAVLMSARTWVETMDGVPNSTRAPLVAEYLQSHFRPAYDRDGVQFWLRRENRSLAGSAEAGPSR